LRLSSPPSKKHVEFANYRKYNFSRAPSTASFALATASTATTWSRKRRLLPRRKQQPSQPSTSSKTRGPTSQSTTSATTTTSPPLFSASPTQSLPTWLAISPRSSGRSTRRICSRGSLSSELWFTTGSSRRTRKTFARTQVTYSSNMRPNKRLRRPWRRCSSESTTNAKSDCSTSRESCTTKIIRRTSPLQPSRTRNDSYPGSNTYHTITLYKIMRRGCHNVLGGKAKCP